MRRRTTLNLVLAAALVAATFAAPSLASPLPSWPDQHSTAYLGVHIEDVTPEQANALKLKEPAGTVVTYVDQDGPACKAGLKEKDVIVGFNGSKIENSEQLGSLIHSTAAGQTVTLTVIRSGQNKDVKVALGSWPRVPANAQSFAAPRPPIAFAGPVMATPPIPDIPSFTVLSSHHGLVVEPLSSQMADFFGVPRGSGVLVRSVEKGSPADAAGLKACDVIVKINNEPVHDMADWGRSMRVRGGKISVGIMRDKREQNLVINLPTPDASRLEGFDGAEFEQQMQAFREGMEKLRPELERTQQQVIAQFNEKELEKMQRDLQTSMKLKQKEIAKLQKEFLQSVPSQKELQKQIEKSMPSQKDMEKMRHEIEASMKNIPSQKEIEQMRRDVEESMKNWPPQLQQQMEELRKQMEQQKFDMQQMMKGFSPEHEF